MACHHCKVQYHGQERFDACLLWLRTERVLLDESLYLLKMGFQSETSSLSFDSGYNWTCQWQFNMIHLFTNPSSESSITSPIPRTHRLLSVAHSLSVCACVRGRQRCGWMCATVGLSVFDPRSVSGQGVLFELAAITVIG